MYQRTEVPRPAGINKDLSPYEMPPEMWSDGININFRRNRVSKALGYANPFEITDSVINPLYLDYFTDNVDTFWVYGSETDIYKTDGQTVVQLGTGYSAARETNWTGCNFNGLILMNNNLDQPQVLDPTDFNSMINLPNWGATAGGDVNAAPWTDTARCEVIRPYKNYLIAMDCYDDATNRFSSMVRWSSPAQAGDVPPSWDPVALGEQAGLYTLSDSPGRIVDGLTLGDYFCIYKTDAVWLIQFVGGDFVFSFRKLFGDESGCLTKDCVAEFDGKHFVLSPNGAYILNGATKQEIMEQWVKDEFFQNVDPLKILESKVVADHNNKEIWVYYTTIDSTWADRALIYNWETQTWTIRELSGISYIAEGLVESTNLGIDDWDSDSQNWNADATRWNNTTPFNPVEVGLLIADYDAKLFYEDGADDKVLDVPITGSIKRIGIDFNDDESFKYVSRIVPHVIGQNPVTVKVFAEDVQSGNPVKIHESLFNPTIDQDVDCHVTGRYIGIEFESQDLFILTGYTIEWEPVGQF